MSILNQSKHQLLILADNNILVQLVLSLDNFICYYLCFERKNHKKTAWKNFKKLANWFIVRTVLECYRCDFCKFIKLKQRMKTQNMNFSKVVRTFLLVIFDWSAHPRLQIWNFIFVKNSMNPITVIFNIVSWFQNIQDVSFDSLK